MGFAFPKEEKLKSSEVIEQLFAEGRSATKFPVKLYYLPLEKTCSEHVRTSGITQAAFAIPKRNFKLAVARNRIKRQMREAYRVHKHLLSEDVGKNFALLFLYISQDKPQYAQLDSSIKALLKDKIT